jgi:hypothetical protein
MFPIDTIKVRTIFNAATDFLLIRRTCKQVEANSE